MCMLVVPNCYILGTDEQGIMERTIVHLVLLVWQGLVAVNIVHWRRIVWSLPLHRLLGLRMWQRPISLAWLACKYYR